MYWKMEFEIGHDIFFYEPLPTPTKIPSDNFICEFNRNYKFNFRHDYMNLLISRGEIVIMGKLWKRYRYDYYSYTQMCIKQSLLINNVHELLGEFGNTNDYVSFPNAMLYCDRITINYLSRRKYFHGYEIPIDDIINKPECLMNEKIYEWNFKHKCNLSRGFFQLNIPEEYLMKFADEFHSKNVMQLHRNSEIAMDSGKLRLAKLLKDKMMRVLWSKY